MGISEATAEQKAQFEKDEEIKTKYGSLETEALQGHLDTISSEIVNI